MPQLLADCLNKIFRYLEEDRVTLRSCLLVNRLWCEVSVGILWRIIRNYNTLIACLPNESKEVLYKDGIITSTSASKPPTFNYAAFCKVLSIYEVNIGIKQLLENQQSAKNQQVLSLDDRYTVIQKVLDLLMSQASLRKLTISLYVKLSSDSLLNIPKFTSFPVAKDCLKSLTELECDSDIYPEFFYQLSQVCHNLHSLSITFLKVISTGLSDLISAQKNLKYLKIERSWNGVLTESIITSLTKLPNTLIKLYLGEGSYDMPLSFIERLTCLQEIVFSFNFKGNLKDFKTLQYVTFPQLQVLKFQDFVPEREVLIKFLKNNGKNLKEFYADYIESSLNPAIAEFCTNIRKLFAGCESTNELKKIFTNCQYLESIKVWCCNYYLSEKDFLEGVAKYSPRNFHELKLCYGDYTRSKLLPKELKSFLISWTNRIPQKSLSFIIIRDNAVTLADNNKNMQIINEYIELGITSINPSRCAGTSEFA